MFKNILDRLLSILLKIFSDNNQKNRNNIPENNTNYDNKMTMLEFFGEKELKERSINIANAGRLFFQSINKVIPNPFMSHLNLLCNLLTLSNIIKIAHSEIFNVYKNKDKFEENFRDMRVILRSFDLKMANRINKTLKNEFYPIEQEKLSLLTMDLFGKLKIEDEKEWLIESITQIEETTNVIKGYTHAPGKDGEYINKLLTIAFKNGNEDGK